MSAFIVSKCHIDALITLGMRRAWPHAPALSWSRIFDKYESSSTRHLNSETQDDTGQMLVDCCVASVAYRYQVAGARYHEQLPGPIDNYYVKPYHWQPVHITPTAVQGLKLIHCYEYQSCEHPEWKESEGRSFCKSLEHNLIGCLDGYEAADWSYVTEDERRELQREALADARQRAGISDIRDRSRRGSE